VLATSKSKMKMKLTAFQKVILIVFGLTFIYFSIIHVPFKTKYEVEYDNLFSNKSNIDTTRLVLILVIISIITATLILLARNVNLNLAKTKISKKKLFVFLSIIAIIIIVASIIYFKPNKNLVQETPVATDSTSTTMDTSTMTPNSNVSQYELQKAETCTPESALENFKSYMKFNYPDWKIYGKPVVQEQSDCTYRIQFTTLDPHIRYEKEVMVVEISFNYDYSRYSVTPIRGTLY
jgi:magnesium-transporting ATPase (P-type)